MVEHAGVDYATIHYSRSFSFILAFLSIASELHTYQKRKEQKPEVKNVQNSVYHLLWYGEFIEHNEKYNIKFLSKRV